MTSGKQILTVDHEDSFREILKEQLQFEREFIATEARDIEEALAFCKDRYFDAIILVDELIGNQGDPACGLLRRIGVRAPIILISSTDSEEVQIKAFDSGASDFISKPFRISVLLARLRAQIRQYEASEYAEFTIGQYTFRPGSKMLVDKENDKDIRLTDKETAIIKFLYHSNGQVIGRAKLLDEVWGYNANLTTHTLETHIYRLRQKIERNPSRAQLLVTETNGYRLIA